MENLDRLKIIIRNGETLLNDHAPSTAHKQWYMQAEKALKEIFGSEWNDFISWENYEYENYYSEAIRRLTRSVHYLQDALLLLNQPESNEVKKPKPMPIVENSRSESEIPIVFIVHGHDEEMKSNVQLFLTRGGLKEIVLHEQPDKNRTVIEKLIEEGSKASYVIALLSPDDVQADGTYRARQNVVLEIGYFIGKLGRARVRLLRKGDAEIPSDLKGIIYEDYDKKGSWKAKLAKEIQAVGIKMDIANIIEKF